MQKNDDLGTRFADVLSPFICCGLRLGAPRLPLRDPRCDLYGILAGFGCNVSNCWELLIKL